MLPLLPSLPCSGPVLPRCISFPLVITTTQPPGDGILPECQQCVKDARPASVSSEIIPSELTQSNYCISAEESVICNQEVAYEYTDNGPDCEGDRAQGVPFAGVEGGLRCAGVRGVVQGGHVGRGVQAGPAGAREDDVSRLRGHAVRDCGGAGRAGTAAQFPLASRERRPLRPRRRADDVG